MAREEGVSARAADEEFFYVTCETCRKTERFESELDVMKFKFAHMGHEVRSGQLESPANAQKPVQAAAREPEVRREAAPPNEGQEQRLVKLLVDLLPQPDGPTVFRVVGYNAPGQRAFILVRTLDRYQEVKEMLERGEMEKTEPEGRRKHFVWDSGAVEVSEEARKQLSRPSQPKPEEQPVKAKPEASKEPPKREVAEPRPQPQPRQEKAVVKPVQKEKKQDVPLLLAKSSHIQQGEEAKREAARVSSVLRSFRWKIEPTYTIGVLFDDNLSIVTNTGLISKGLISKIEEIGYELVAIDVEGGKPTAWFKRKGAEAQAGVGIGPVDVEAEPGQDFEIR
jgi:hypothetical protein